ncbi:metallophosphoesterase [Allomesorhizobium alhagi]|jgi:serine/threonine protein phosphatase 1|uniref:Serine/threonine specific protein phosphatase protein n=1 Tax=Mesorhizobium alhagi CCNWXJ12-2 TaxID=1107882 RepID=H0HJF9_9HYPH|nr:metallophosphoesterase [Mesorhizobium alhagi]EHK59124.1 serine/threonine specific protein phosphatase protein [Mesorhizobium alhagi CCNWXJ12-2]
MRKLAGLLGLHKNADRERRARLRLDTGGIAIYAVGDVHGCLDELLSLERAIVANGKNLPGRKLIIMLGDYVDRGPASSQVIDHLLAPPPAGFERICLAGNHEVVMLDYIDGRLGLADWMSMGAASTLLSYGIDHDRLAQIYRSSRQIDEVIRKTIPAAHIAFLRSLPILVEAQRFIFVHAGVRPEVDLERQSDYDLAFIRSEFYERAHLLKKYVVHGHTPVAEAKRDGMRVNIDTGAVFGGRLTALRIWQDRGLYLTN